ncbi:hypothetical protein [Bradyrhizobium sp.]|uniref:hypothetical protein n=1 Tax=Bradyrhizobium sp. TaxID=376 RepID=UPI00238CDAB7|nr:hypothetical protein [Bradyrhizobium sp.]MDE1933504.1 hypothetical protein [Bradyrhizobium sp.]MDE2061212.1 hypothetical protein [Bradyrhizobium sp.]
MEKFVAHANIDHYLDLLNNGSVSSHNRSVINKLLIEEEDKLGHDQEQLEFAESRAAACRARADRQRRLLDCFDPGSTEWIQAERLLVNFESLAQFVEGFCRQMRRQVSESRL